MPRTIVYGGFCEGNLDWLEVDDGFGGNNWRKVPAIFPKRQQARVQYEDVRRIEIRELPRKRPRRSQS